MTDGWLTDGFTHSYPHPEYASRHLKIFVYNGYYYVKHWTGRPLVYTDALENLAPLLQAEANEKDGAHKLVYGETFQEYMENLRIEGKKRLENARQNPGRAGQKERADIQKAARDLLAELEL